MTSTTSEQSLFKALTENKLHIFDQAKAMHSLCSHYGYTQSKLAKQLNISQSCVGNKIRLLQYSAHEQAQILEFSLTERHARTILRVEPPKREKIIAAVGKMRLTVQQTEELVEKYANYCKDSQTIQGNGISPPSLQEFIVQTQHSADRLRSLGFKITCLTESDESWTRITVTIIE